MSHKTVPVECDTEWEQRWPNAETPPPPPQRGYRQDNYSLGDEGQVILQWPEKMSQESYEELKEWIDLQMRKIARLNGVTPKK